MAATTRSQAKKSSASPQDLDDTIGAFDEETTLRELCQGISQFAEEREWDQFHSPRNLLLAMVGEVGELAELFQWKGDSSEHLGLEGFSDRDKVLVGEELSDVLLYLLRLSHRCNVNLPRAAQRKLKLNAKKYPVDKARGRSAKYTEYVRESTEGHLDMASRYTHLRHRRSSGSNKKRTTDESESAHHVEENSRTDAPEHEESREDVSSDEDATEKADQIVANIGLAEESVLSIENMLSFTVGMGFMYLFSSGKVQHLLTQLVDWMQGT
eukprot:gb/GECG01007119.1/.p1 GENE.gb/GECG01007119.1/~~gb/GECG01007119.1/.p1  ORF type:complete len:269 (+),score=37.93 gb/GECG01007119.1/:1-807(+)